MILQRTTWLAALKYLQIEKVNPYSSVFSELQRKKKKTKNWVNYNRILSRRRRSCSRFAFFLLTKRFASNPASNLTNKLIFYYTLNIQWQKAKGWSLSITRICSSYIIYLFTFMCSNNSKKQQQKLRQRKLLSTVLWNNVLTLTIKI